MLQPALENSGKANVVLQHRDTQYRKIFVGGLPYHTTDDSLRDYFLVFGEIEEAVVITDRQTGKSKGYGFVTMTDATAADRACKDPNPIIDGRKANVNLAYIGAKPRNNTVSGMTALRPLHGAIVPATPPFATPYSFLPQPQVGHYMPQTSFLTPFAGLVSDVTGSAAVPNAYSNIYGNASVQPAAPSIPSAYILPTIPTQPGIQVGALSSVPGLTYATVAPQSDAQNQTFVSASSPPMTYSHLVAQLQQQTAEKH